MIKIFDRKKELIKRDPLFNDLSETLNKICELRIKKDPFLQFRTGDPILEQMEKFNPATYWRYDKEFYFNPLAEDESAFLKRWDEFIEGHKKKYPDHWRFQKLSGSLRLKWLINFEYDFSNRKISIIAPYTDDEVIWVGSPPFDNYTTHNASIHYPQLKWLPYPNDFHKEPTLADINEFVTPGYHKGSEEWLPILINTSRLNKSDAKKIKRFLWEIIETRLQKGADKKPHFESPDCAFLYRLRKEDTFQKYLKWYDIHTKEKLSFRLIAHIEKQGKQKGAELLETLKSKKVRWGSPIKGEDKIEKGVKLIYKAIHRTDYSRKKIEPVIEGYNCPTHQKNNCPASCNYHKEWSGRFNRLNPV